MWSPLSCSHPLLTRDQVKREREIVCERRAPNGQEEENEERKRKKKREEKRRGSKTRREPKEGKQASTL